VRPERVRKTSCCCGSKAHHELRYNGCPLGIPGLVLVVSSSSASNNTGSTKLSRKRALPENVAPVVEEDDIVREVPGDVVEDDPLGLYNEFGAPDPNGLPIEEAFGSKSDENDRGFEDKNVKLREQAHRTIENYNSAESSSSFNPEEIGLSSKIHKRCSSGLSASSVQRESSFTCRTIIIQDAFRGRRIERVKGNEGWTTVPVKEGWTTVPLKTREKSISLKKEEHTQKEVIGRAAPVKSLAKEMSQPTPYKEAVQRGKQTSQMSQAQYVEKMRRNIQSVEKPCLSLLRKVNVERWKK
jgi:hypothetical protein